ncbi:MULTISPECIES: DUF1656 domain-containing protein [Shewanella]|jgi:hypothetical protein|uniref:Efflux system membrane protein n=3 Tax=Bacteria TaxID=2 RepID=A0A2T3GZR9_9GAMM|nr:MULTISPECIES: DUF1656 domain-containing protein [Shewanella]AXQ15061.1 DUF1656 domain-containing protein [Shewanella algae]AYV12850.1 DUF1656 domain-containing protein [Shewanella algae]EKT4488314.1 DUF1656 domain-containing protein [Shewanella algae]MBC8797386.1 DUF1656 domain-containing protein [Shewanella algae]MBO2546912.1 DUF1656 domain-containing protein [Shewanella algae]
MLEELALGGLLFSPLVLFAPLALVLWFLTRLVLHWTGLYAKIWRVAWFEVALFVCYLALIIYLFEN